jgi:hypothetical protein
VGIDVGVSVGTSVGGNVHVLQRPGHACPKDVQGTACTLQYAGSSSLLHM